MWPPREPHDIAAFGTTMPALATAKTWLAGLGVASTERSDPTARYAPKSVLCNCEHR
jgi:hypothetical protein